MAGDNLGSLPRDYETKCETKGDYIDLGTKFGAKHAMSEGFPVVWGGGLLAHLVLGSIATTFVPSIFAGVAGMVFVVVGGVAALAASELWKKVSKANEKASYEEGQSLLKKSRLVGFTVPLVFTAAGMAAAHTVTLRNLSDAIDRDLQDSIAKQEQTKPTNQVLNCAPFARVHLQEVFEKAGNDYRTATKNIEVVIPAGCRVQAQALELKP